MEVGTYVFAVYSPRDPGIDEDPKFTIYAHAETLGALRDSEKVQQLLASGLPGCTFLEVVDPAPFRGADSKG